MPALVVELQKLDAVDIKVTVGGVIPPGDYAMLHDVGAVAVFGPGTPITVSADKLLSILGQDM